MLEEFVRKTNSNKNNINGNVKWQCQRKEEWIPTLQYIFRHNRAIFWTLRDQLPESLGNHPLFRLALGWMCPPKVTFLKLPATPRIKHEMMFERVYQDIVLPIRTLELAVEKAGKLFGIWPILIYPSRIYDHGKGHRGIFPCPRPEDLVHHKDEEGHESEDAYAMYYDLGVYGIPHHKYKTTSTRNATKDANGYGQKHSYQAVHAMREMERFTRDVGGAPFLYADTFMDREEFNEMFNTELYERVRKDKRYGIPEQHFPHVFDKTVGGPRQDRWQKQFEYEKAQARKEK